MEKTEMLRVLKAARSRIERPENWTTGTCARDAHGFSADAVASNAVCWCAAGSIVAEVGHRNSREPWDYLDVVAGAMYDGYGTPWVNDTEGLGHPAVLNLYDAAIEKLTSEIEG